MALLVPATLNLSLKITVRNDKSKKKKIFFDNYPNNCHKIAICFLLFKPILTIVGHHFLFFFSKLRHMKLVHPHIVTNSPSISPEVGELEAHETASLTSSHNGDNGLNK